METSGLTNVARFVMCFFSLLYVVDNLTPFFSEVENVYSSSQALLKVVTKIDSYTQSLEHRANNLFERVEQSYCNIDNFVCFTLL